MGSGGDLIDHEMAVGVDEELDAQEADEIEGIGYRESDLFGLGLDRLEIGRGRDVGAIEDMVTVGIDEHGVDGHVVVGVSGDEDGDFGLQIDDRFGDPGFRAERVDGRLEVGGMF